MTITHFDVEMARIARLNVIEHLIKKAKGLKHVPNCPQAKDDHAKCGCPSAVIADWLESEMQR